MLQAGATAILLDNTTNRRWRRLDGQWLFLSVARQLGVLVRRGKVGRSGPVKRLGTRARLAELVEPGRRMVLLSEERSSMRRLVILGREWRRSTVTCRRGRRRPRSAITPTIAGIVIGRRWRLVNISHIYLSFSFVRSVSFQNLSQDDVAVTVFSNKHTNTKSRLQYG